MEIDEPPYVVVTRMDVSCFPIDDEDHPSFHVMVEYRGRGLWAVTNGFGQCLNTENEWDWEMRPSEREDDWLGMHRFPRDEAVHRAREIAPLIRVNGWTVQRLMEARKADAQPPAD